MMSFESRTMARKRASLRSRSAVTWSTVRAARRPTTRVDTIARTTIASNRPSAMMPSALTSFLSVFDRLGLEPRSRLPASTVTLVEEGGDDRPGRRGGSHRAGGDVGLELPGQCGGRAVGGEPVKEGIGDLRPHPVAVLGRPHVV